MSLEENVRLYGPLHKVEMLPFVLGVWARTQISKGPAIETTLLNMCEVVRDQTIAQTVTLIDDDIQVVGVGVKAMPTGFRKPLANVD